MCRLTDDGECRMKDDSHVKIIKSGDGHVTRNINLHRGKCMKHVAHHEIVAREKRRRPSRTIDQGANDSVSLLPRTTVEVGCRNKSRGQHRVSVAFIANSVSKG